MPKFDDENAVSLISKEKLPINISANKILPPRPNSAKTLRSHPLQTKRHRHNILHIGYPIKINLKHELIKVIQIRNVK